MISESHPQFVAFLRHLKDAEQIVLCLENPTQFQNQFCAFLTSLPERTSDFFAVTSTVGTDSKVLVNLPRDREVDIQLSLPDHEIKVQYRNQSLTLVLPQQACVTNWQSDLTPAEPFLGLPNESEVTRSHFSAGHVRLAQQVVIDLNDSKGDTGG